MNPTLFLSLIISTQTILFLIILHYVFKRHDKELKHSDDMLTEQHYQIDVLQKEIDYYKEQIKMLSQDL